MRGHASVRKPALVAQEGSRQRIRDRDKGFYDVLPFSAGVVGHLGKSEPAADCGAEVAPEWAPYPGDGGSGDAR